VLEAELLMEGNMKKLIVFFLGASTCLYLGCATSGATRNRDSAKDSGASKDRSPVQTSTPNIAQTRNRNTSTTNANEKKAAAFAENVKIDYKPSDTKVATKLERNPQLSSILNPLLPARTSLTDAAAGFKKQGQFIAALHVSKNLGLPFNQIKAKMTGEDRMSLGDAIRELRPDMAKGDAKDEVKKGEKQAKADEKEAKAEAKKAEAVAKLAANRKS
jgi:hypothetical protein